ncbi:FAD:protein FMN transferase [Nonomuraea soli]|uniref:FAD:protein FMN transferase n=1 Tax=Nonomuraea soli TaxID=1032476 RepID=A0A7W0HSD0_9ACTN|nr:FAD:protein FMN transferase [Nonomuraea soli]MBA2893919.1 thiamine biosynthesis lipoprotein [Nonomuraea soli]
MTFPGSARMEVVMGIPVMVDIRTALPQRELTPLLDDAFGWLTWVGETLAPEMERFSGGQTIEQIPELIEIQHRCNELFENTGGWFDRDDHEAYIRGWAVERLSRALTNAGAVDHRIDAGGDVRVRGSAAPGRQWRIGVRDPQQGTMRTVLIARDLAVATVGHVTVSSADLGVAGAYASAMHRMDLARARRFADRLPYRTVIVTPDGTQEYGGALQLAG